ncbi:GH92 family glycosyl hydrolase [Flavihumibacter sp. CACIAM 22H1]|uniref:GH92 family glycosyl hydrolase n=1 Tax=Flavihumibacter sp. CACIAM 22H1 TaxID=1812911 RepID=UPI000AA3EBA1|nr:GH92 family glycosyl hydrolase [Flavihumibacter sp. CACIAM 22H1]
MNKPLFYFLVGSFCLQATSLPIVSMAQNNPNPVSGQPLINPLDFVNPFIGTTNAEQPTKWGAEGGTYPGAVAPWGFVQLSPETKTGHLKGYDYRDSTIYFFSCANHSSGYPNGSAGTMKVLPLAHPRFRKKPSAGRPFRHEQEKASPGYYQVQFSDDQGSAEMTTAVHTGLFRFRFPTGVLPRVYLGEMGKLTPRSKRLLYSERLNLLLSFPTDMMGMENVEDGTILTFAQKTGDNSLLMKISLSTVDEAGSMRNMQTECPDWEFDQFKKINQQRWADLLNTISIEDESADNKIKFYTALYHSYLVPWIISDVDGRYKGARGKIYQTKGKNQYGKFSPWDTYRSLHPLLTLLQPAVQEDMIRSMLDVFVQTGKLPKGPMTGYHSLPVILDSWRKGIKGFDIQQAWTAMKASLDSSLAEPDFAEYTRLGYVSAAFSESVTKTVEFAYNDWIMAEMAKELGDTAAYALYAPRALNYRNLFHFPSGFIVPRKGTGFIEEPESNGYKEGDKWIYSYVVPHDARGLVNLMGGDAEFSAKLDSALSTGLLLFDNEPAFHVPYLFNFTDEPAVSQAWVREIMQQKFLARPGGIPGNDDLGSMSSWFVFSAMGFYPVAVGAPVYEIGSPLFQKMHIRLPGDRSLAILAPENSSRAVYLQSVELDGQPLNRLFLQQAELAKAGTLRFKMGEKPANAAFQATVFTGRSATELPVKAKLEAVYTAAKNVYSNDSIWIQFTLSNKGAAGIYPVQLWVNDQLYGTKNCWVPADSTLQDSVALQLYQPGNHLVRLNEGSAQLVQVALPPREPANSYVIEKLDAKPLAPLGKEHQLLFTIKNQTGRLDTALVAIKNNGLLVKEETVVLQPGERKLVGSSFIPKNLGIQLIEIGQQSARVKTVERTIDKMVLDVAMGKIRPGEQVPDLSGLGNKGSYRKETRVMGDNSTQTIEYVQFENSASLDELEEEITVMAWVLPGKQRGMADIISKGDFIVIQQTGRTLSFFAGGWGQGSCDVALPANWENKWHHIAAVCKGRLYTLYIDGVKAGSFEIDRAVNLSSRLRWVLGGNEEFPDQRYFNGRINGFKVFAAALTADEIEGEMLPME